jgi:hypothetical protein
MDDYTWVHNLAAVDLEDLSRVYRPLGGKPPEALSTVFGNSVYNCFACASGVLVRAGRVVAYRLDCANLADVASATRPGHGDHPPSS